MANDIFKQVERAAKAGYSPDEIADYIMQQNGIDPAAARGAGYTSEQVIQELAVPGSTDIAPTRQDPYAIASRKMKEQNAMRRSLVPLGAAFMAPIQGVREMFGNEPVGRNAVESQEAIKRTIPGGEGGMTAGSIGTTSLALAPLAPIGAAATGMRGAAGRALASGAGMFGVEAVQPMGDKNRLLEASKAGGLGLVASPAAEGAVHVASSGVSELADKVVMPIVRRIGSRVASTGQQASGAAIEQELMLQLKAQGVDYAKLDANMRSQLLNMTRDALTPQNLSNNALVRAARVEQTIGVPATRGQAERSTELMRMEQQFGGEEIMKREAAQNEALAGSLERLATRRGGSLDPMQQGESFRAATLARQASADAAISDAYRIADEAVGDVPVSVDALADVLNKNPLMPGVDTVLAKLKKAGVQIDDNGEIVAGQSIPARFMGEIRKVASGMTQSPDRAGIGKATKDAIDDTFEGSGITQYSEAVSRARAGFRQFDDRQIPAGIAATRKGVEDITATSKLSDWVMAKSPEQLRELKEFFARGNEQKLREFYGDGVKATGVQAVKDLKAAAVGAVLNKGLRKSATAEGGAWTTSPEAIVTAYQKFGGGSGPASMARADAKMRSILGAQDFAEFKRIMKVAEDLSVPGRAQMKGSADANTSLAMRIMGLLGMSPAAGVEAAGMVKGAAKATSAKKSAQWSASEQAKAMRRPVIPTLPVGAQAGAGKVGSLATLIGNQ